MTAPRRPQPGPRPGPQPGPQRDDPATGPTPDPDAPLGRAAATVGMVALVLVAALGAAISVLLTPARIGVTLVPFAVAVAVVLNVVAPWLAFRMTGSRGLAALPVLVFFVAGWAMSISPSGDVLLAGGSNGQTAISYATLLGGVLVGAVTAVRVR